MTDGSSTISSDNSFSDRRVLVRLLNVLNVQFLMRLAVPIQVPDHFRQLRHSDCHRCDNSNSIDEKNSDKRKTHSKCSEEKNDRDKKSINNNNQTNLNYEKDNQQTSYSKSSEGISSSRNDTCGNMRMNSNGYPTVYSDLAGQGPYQLQYFVVVPDTGGYELWLPSSDCSKGNRKCPAEPNLDALCTSPDDEFGFEKTSSWKFCTDKKYSSVWSSFGKGSDVCDRRTLSVPFQRTLYNVSKSLKGKDVGDQRRISYGDGTRVTSLGVKDSFVLDGLSNPISDQKFYRAVDFSGSLARGHKFNFLSDGILGLSVRRFEIQRWNDQPVFGIKTDDDDADDNNSIFSFFRPVKHQLSFIENLFLHNPSLTPQFSFFLAPFSSAPFSRSPYPLGSRDWEKWTADLWQKSKSFLVLGDPDLTAFSLDSKFQYSRFSLLPAERGPWMAEMSSIGLAGYGTSVNLSFPRSPRSAPALVDSGSSFVILRSDVFDEVAASFLAADTHCHLVEDEMGQRTLNCPCHMRTRWAITRWIKGSSPPPSVVFSFFEMQNVTEMIQSDSDQINQTNSKSDHDSKKKMFSLKFSPAEYLFPTRYEGKIICKSIFQRGIPDLPVPVILGTAFMKSVYTTFNLELNAVGFARSKLADGRDYSAALRQPNLNSSNSKILWVCIIVFVSFLFCFGGCFGIAKYVQTQRQKERDLEMVNRKEGDVLSPLMVHEIANATL